MPTQHRSLRVNEDDWTALGQLGERAPVITAFIRWYLRHPGAELPARPEPPNTE